jgi:hypothetical protein
MVPSLVTDEVQAVYNKLVDTVHTLFGGIINNRVDNSKSTMAQKQTNSRLQLLNAPEFFFVSHKMATAFPSLVESMIVQSYRSHLPGEISKKW